MKQKPAPHPAVDCLLHPYVFMLKEGGGIQKDYLDYSLLMLQMGQGDILRSPQKHRISSTLFTQLLRK